MSKALRYLPQKLLADLSEQIEATPSERLDAEKFLIELDRVLTPSEAAAFAHLVEGANKSLEPKTPYSTITRLRRKMHRLAKRLEIPKEYLVTIVTLFTDSAYSIPGTQVQTRQIEEKPIWEPAPHNHKARHRAKSVRDEARETPSPRWRKKSGSTPSKPNEARILEERHPSDLVEDSTSLVTESNVQIERWRDERLPTPRAEIDRFPNTVRIRFLERAGNFLRSTLIKKGWRWNSFTNCWYHSPTDEAWNFAQRFNTDQPAIKPDTSQPKPKPTEQLNLL